MSDFLNDMATSSAARAAAVSTVFSSSVLDAPVVPLRTQEFGVIAEIKDRSPAEGALAQDARGRVARAKQYAAGGAAAISVLTEPSRFDGDLAHLREVVEASCDDSVPVMRKDFLVEPVQILEAKAAGASGVLLIAAMLSDAKLEEMLGCAYEHSLFVLLESFDEDDLKRTRRLMEREQHLAAATNRMLLAGVNTRNLRTLAVDPERLHKLAGDLPDECICVAESGLRDADDASRVAAMGYEMALVGTALMRSANPGALIRSLSEAGRTAT